MIITFRKPVDDIDPGTIQGYSDADWTGEEHSGRSTLGMVVIKNDGPICWGSKQQGVVSRSTTESEYIAMFTVGNHLTWLSTLETQLKFEASYAPELFCDNQAAIAIANSDENIQFKCSKFINVKYHWVRDERKRGTFSVCWVETKNNVADPFTKRLAHGPLKKLRKEFMEPYSMLEVWDNEGSDEEVSRGSVE